MPVNYDRDLFEIAFNPLHILDILRHTSGETVRFRFIDAFSPAVAVDTSKKEKLETLFVIMPMRRPT